MKKVVEMEEIRTIKDTPKGEFVRLVSKAGKVGKSVYILIGYDRTERKYECQKWDDMNSYRYIKGDSLVQVGFTF